MPFSSNSFFCRCEHMLVVSMVICNLFQEIVTHGAEGVDKNTCFQTDATMWQVRSDIIAIARSEYFLLLTDSYFKTSAGHIGSLGMGMLMECSNGSLIEFYFHHHQVFIVTHNLADYAITRILPLNVGGNLEGITFLFHNQNLMVNSSLMSLFSISYINS